MSVNDKYSLETHLAEIYHKFPDGGLLKERYADKEIRLEKGMHALMTSGTERLEKLINEIRNFIYTESLSISQRYTGALGVGVCEDKSLKLRAYAGKKCSCFPAGRIYSVFAERYTGAETMAKILIFLVSSCSVCAFVPYSGEPLCVYEYISEKVNGLFRKIYGSDGDICIISSGEIIYSEKIKYIMSLNGALGITRLLKTGKKIICEGGGADDEYIKNAYGVKAGTEKTDRTISKSSAGTLILADESADVKTAAEQTAFDVEFDAGLEYNAPRICVCSDKSIDLFIYYLIENGFYLLSKSEMKKLNEMFGSGNLTSTDAEGILTQAGIKCPKNIRAILYRMNYLSDLKTLYPRAPFLKIVRSSGLCDMTAKALHLRRGGFHTLGLHSNDEAVVENIKKTVKAFNLVVNSAISSEIFSGGEIKITADVFPHKIITCGDLS